VAAYRKDNVHGKAIIGPKGCKIQPLKQKNDRTLRMKPLPGATVKQWRAGLKPLVGGKENFISSVFIGKRVNNEWQQIPAVALFDSGYAPQNVGMSKRFFGEHFARKEMQIRNGQMVEITKWADVWTPAERDNAILFNTKLYYKRGQNVVEIDVAIEPFDDRKADIVFGNHVIDLLSQKFDYNIKFKL
jgi:hypothetical protein